MKSRCISRHVRFAALGLTALGSLALVGCGAQQQTRGPQLELQPESERLARAHQLAVEAQRAQQAGDRETAMRLYGQSLQQSQDLHAVWNNMGLLMMEEENYFDAVEMFRTAADLAPHDPQPYYNVALAYDRALHTERALEFYTRSLERNPRYVPALRGYVGAVRLLDLAEPVHLERVKLALMVERDPAWRHIHEREKIRIESALREQREASRPRAWVE